MPEAASPASYIPGVSLKRGSLTSEPVIPAGNGGAGLGANGFTGAGAGVGDGVCASATAAKHEHKNSDAASKRNVCTRFIFFPLVVLTQHCLHYSDLGPLAAVDVCREIEQIGFLSRTGGIEKVLYHDQSPTVVLDHSRQKQTVKLRSLCRSQSVHLLFGKHSGH